jgi:hypothetical protein
MTRKEKGIVSKQRIDEGVCKKGIDELEEE